MTLRQRYKYLFDLFVRKRFVFFVAAVAVAIACVFLIPRTRINTDMTRYLPDDSPMKQGIEQMAEEFGEDGVGASMVRVMFWSLPDSLRAATKDELSTMDGISNVMYLYKGQTVRVGFQGEKKDKVRVAHVNGKTETID